MENENEVLEKISKVNATWHRMANSLRFLQALLGTAAILCSLFVTAFAGSKWLETPECIKLLSFIATASLTLLTAFNISQKGNNARNAWRHLNKAIMQKKNGNISTDELIKAYEEGEKILGDVDFIPPSSGPKPS
jgi:hypothetical protein